MEAALCPTEDVDPRTLTLLPANPWRHSEEQLRAVRASVEEHGFSAPLVVNRRSGYTLDGNGRLEVALAAGWKTVPVRYVDFSPEQERRFVATVSQTARMVALDEERMAALLQELSASEIGFPAGWDQGELDGLLASLAVEPESGLLPGADPDALPEQVETRCKPGDLWRLGEHRLLCGDSSDPDRVNLAMHGHSCPAMLTDPPYRMGKDIENDDLADDPYYALHCEVMLQAPLDVNATMIWFHGTRAFPVALDTARRAGWTFERMLWLYKSNDITFPWRGWILTSESILVFSQGRGNWNDLHPFHHDTYEFNHHGGELADGVGHHPTVKPCEVVSDLVERIAAPGQAVYDPLAGSGTTLIACEQTGRAARCIEIEPRYCDLILARWEQATGKTAELL